MLCVTDLIKYSDSGDLRSVQLVWPGAEDQNVDLLNRTQCHANETAAMSEVSHIKRSGVPSIAQRMKVSLCKLTVW